MIKYAKQVQGFSWMIKQSKKLVKIYTNLKEYPERSINNIQFHSHPNFFSVQEAF